MCAQQIPAVVLSKEHENEHYPLCCPGHRCHRSGFLALRWEEWNFHEPFDQQRRRVSAPIHDRRFRSARSVHPQPAGDTCRIRAGRRWNHREGNADSEPAPANGRMAEAGGRSHLDLRSSSPARRHDHAAGNTEVPTEVTRECSTNAPSRPQFGLRHTRTLRGQRTSRGSSGLPQTAATARESSGSGFTPVISAQRRVADHVPR